MVGQGVDQGQTPAGRKEWRRLSRLLREGADAKAEQLCQRAIVHYPRSARWKLALAWIQIRRDRLDRALATAQEVLGDEPDNPQVYRILAYAYARREEGGRALEMARHAQHLAPDAASAELLRRLYERFPQVTGVGSVFDVHTEPDKPVTHRDPGEMVPRWYVDTIPDREMPSPQLSEAATVVDASATLEEVRFDPEEWLVPRRSRLSRHSRMHFDATVSPEVNAQLGALFGASVFDEWVDPVQVEPSPPDRRATLRRWVPRLSAALAVLALLGVGGWIARTGLARQAVYRRTALALELRQLLQVGAFEEAAGLLPRLRAQVGGDSEKEDLHAPLVARAEATLYRCFDADRDRLAGLRVISESPEDYDGVVARSMVLSEVERLGWIDALEGVEALTTGDSSATFLLSRAYARADDAAHAECAQKLALERNPLHVFHLGAAARWSALRGDTAHARRLADQILDQDPASPWLRSVQLLLDEDPASGVPARTAHPVALAALRFAEAVRDLRASDHVAAHAELDAAVAAIHGEAPFVLDLFDELLSEGAPGAARHLVSSQAWPSTGRLVRLAEGRLLLAEGEPARALQPFEQAWWEGARDPRAGLAYARSIVASGRDPAAAQQLVSRMLERWPHHDELELELAQLLYRGGDRRDALKRAQLVADRASARGADRIQAQALLLLAQGQLDTERPARARALARRSASLDPTNADVRALLESLSEKEGDARRSPRKPRRRVHRR